MPSIVQPSLEITQLSDVDLGNRLRDFGVNPGPILATTRNVYERKLTVLMAGGETGVQYVTGQEETYSTDDSEPDDYEQEEEEEDLENLPEIVPHTVLQEDPIEHVTSRVEEMSVHHRVSREQETYTRPPIRGSPVRKPMQTRPETAETKTKPTKKGISLWIKMLLFLVFLGLVYLVYINIESVAARPKSIDMDVEMGQ